MTLPEEECAFFFAAMAQLEPGQRVIFAERVANILGAYSPFWNPGPAMSIARSGGVDRAVEPPASEEVRAVSRWDQARPKFERSRRLLCRARCNGIGGSSLDSDAFRRIEDSRRYINGTRLTSRFRNKP